MSYPQPGYGPQGAYPPPAPPATAPQPRTAAGDGVRHDLRVAGLIVVALAVLGALLGLLWSAWSPPGPRGLVLSPGVVEPDETEAFAAGDGRFLAIAAVVGVLAAIVAWRLTRNRGPAVLAALGIGGVAGSLLMELVGHLTGGGTFDGKPNTIIDRLPLSLHMQGMLFVEAGLAVLVYGMIVAFAVRDDLGRPDPVRDALLPVPAQAGPVPAGYPEPPAGY